MSVLHENSEYYENKYLKYKAKYLELKQIIGGGATNVSDAKNREKKRAKMTEGAKVNVDYIIRNINEILQDNGILKINIDDKFFKKPHETEKKVKEIYELLKYKLLNKKINFTDDQKASIQTAVENLNKSSKLESKLDLLIELIKEVPVKQPVKIVQL